MTPNNPTDTCPRFRGAPECEGRPQPERLPACRPLVDRFGAEPEAFPEAPRDGREPCIRDLL